MSGPYEHAEASAISARERLAEALHDMSRARDLLQSSETKRGLSIAITHAETALLWLRAATE